jgi:hypothetical protein
MPKKLDPKVAEKVMIKQGWKPLEPYKSALAKWKCKCIKCGNLGTPQFSNVQNGSGCTVCKNAEKINSRTLSHVDAAKIMAQAGMKPLVLYKGIKTKWKCKCLVCKKITYPTLGNVIQGHEACAYCTGRKVDPKDAIKVMKKAKLSPLEPFRGADKPWKCECLQCGRTTSPAYSWIKRGQGGCRPCGVKKGGIKNTLLDIDAKEVMLKANLKPLEKYKKADQPWKCRCLVCKKIVYPSFSNVNSGNNGCLYCIGKKVDAKDAIALMRKNGFEPLESYVDSKKKWKSRHIKCGNIVYPQYNTIQNRQTGCSACANYGIDYTKPAYLYIVQHHEFQSIKVGISNNHATPNRIRTHQINGWIHYKSFNFESGQIAEDLENTILRWIRIEKNLGIHLTKKLMGAGYTETVDAMEITVIEIEREIKKVIKQSKVN